MYNIPKIIWREMNKIMEVVMVELHKGLISSASM